MCLYFSNLFFKARSFYLNHCTGPSLPLEKCRVNNTRSSSSLVLLNILWSFQKMKKRFTVKFVFRFGWRVCLLYEWCSRKSLFELSEASVHWCFEKIAAPKISTYFSYFPAKHPGWSSFNDTLRSSWSFSKKLFRAAIL